MNNIAAFRFRVDTSEVAQKLGVARELIEDKVISGVEGLSIAAHDFMIKQVKVAFANDDFKRNFYLGIGQFGKDASGKSSNDPRVDQTPKNLRWIKVADGMWVVELDEHARWLEEGRPETFMGDWLLKPGAKGVKRAKDGSLYRAIPFKQTKGNAPAEGANAALAGIVKDYAKQNKISLTKVVNNPDGSPKLGVVHKLDIRPSDAAGFAPGLIFSKPRTDADAALSGLKAHSGIFKLQGAIVVQRKNPRSKKGKVIKETVVFRTISSKHKAEGRWMYPEVTPLNLFGQALDWANQQWGNIVQHIERSLVD